MPGLILASEHCNVPGPMGFQSGGKANKAKKKKGNSMNYKMHYDKREDEHKI